MALILRDYQIKTVDSILREWQTVSSTLCSIPTGGGKTLCFAELIRRCLPKRALVLVHREEIAFQNRKKIESVAGVECEIEMADMRASVNIWNRMPVVIASVQTMISGGQKKRMEIFSPDDFGILIVDEAHHGVAASWCRVINYFKQNKDLKIAGFTATPDRADEIALGKIFETVAIDIEILDLIEEGWLVPVEQQMVEIDGLDFSAIRTTAGDLNGADLAEVMEAEKNMQGVAAATMDIIGNRKAVVFTASVKQSEMLCEIFNRYKSGMAAWICGKTLKDDRRSLLKEYSEGNNLQIMVNCGVLGEGWDCPAAEVVIQARPTKSRSLYAQQIGRILRPMEGLLDNVETPDSRKALITNSSKRAALVVDFVGNSGRHKLICTADILGGKVSDEAIELAIRKAREGGKPIRMDETLEEEQERLEREAEERRKLEEARRVRLVAKATFSMQSVSPFDVFHLTPTKERGWDQDKMLSEKQRALLLKQGVDTNGMTYSQGRQLIAEMFRRWNGKLCTIRQAKWLNSKGYDTKNMPMKEASRIMNEWAKNNWRRPEGLIVNVGAEV